MKSFVKSVENMRTFQLLITGANFQQIFKKPQKINKKLLKTC